MDVTRLTCCPENITFSKTWMIYEISTCTMEIIASIAVFLYTLIFGTYYLLTHRERKIDVDSAKSPKSGLHLLQKFLLMLMPIFSVVNIILQAKQIYGYLIISTITTLAVYPYFIYILNVERCKNLSNGNDKVVFAFWILSFVLESFVFINASSQNWSLNWIARFNRLDTVAFAVRYAISLLLFSLGLIEAADTEKVPKYSRAYERSESAFSQTLDDDNKSSLKSSWQKFKTLAYFLWPEENIFLKLRIVICFALLFAGIAINITKPLYEKKIIDSVTDYPGEFRWELVVIYVSIDIFRELSASLHSFLWNRIEEYAACKTEVEIFRHLHSLSLRWHLERKTGEVLRIKDRGAYALRYLLYYVIFVILPTIVDGILAVIFFISVFDKWLGLIVFSSMILYFVVSVCLTEWRTKIQERKNEAENDQRARSVDSLLNFETVKCFGAESHEVECYEKALLDSQREESMSDITSQLFDILQNLIDNFATLAGSLMCLYMVVNNQELTIGDYVLFTSYLSRLQGPLNQIAYSYRQIHEQFVDMDSLIKLLQLKPEIADSPDATALKIEEGQIEFSNVSFSYIPEKVILKNVSFVIPPGKTIALVGPSGAGKSTVMRLLFRFYDVNEGSILIDGQDVKSVKQHSLRKAIGVVPQDTVLFNNTIKHNIQYGKFDASDEEVVAAAKHADIHDRILSFPEGYETEVGERGLRLSGGEKQRVAIARTILKAPKIVLLDEATSALDTQTERNIQAALNRVCANRSTIIIAHRLSTIIHADEILIMKEGEIVERGRHEDLLLKNGIYYDMWEAQFKKEEDTVEEKPSLDDPTE